MPIFCIYIFIYFPYLYASLYIYIAHILIYEWSLSGIRNNNLSLKFNKCVGNHTKYKMLLNSVLKPELSVSGFTEVLPPKTISLYIHHHLSIFRLFLNYLAIVFYSTNFKSWHLGNLFLFSKIINFHFFLCCYKLYIIDSDTLKTINSAENFLKIINK